VRLCENDRQHERGTRKNEKERKRKKTKVKQVRIRCQFLCRRLPSCDLALCDGLEMAYETKEKVQTRFHIDRYRSLSAIDDLLRTASRTA
jgi:hypothetical protein